MKSTKKLCAIFSLITLLLSSEARAYVTYVTIYKNPKTGKFVFIFNDVHPVGTIEENQQQMNLFIEKVLKKFDTQQMGGPLLVEDMREFHYNSTKFQNSPLVPNELKRNKYVIEPIGNITIDICRLNAHENVSNTLSYTESGQPTWLGPPLTLAYEAQNFNNIPKISVDPRYPLLIWTAIPISISASLGDFAAMKSILDHVRAQDFADLLKADPALRHEVAKIREFLTHDEAYFLSAAGIDLKGTPQIQVSNQTAIQKGLLTDKHVEKMSELWKLDRTRFVHALDMFALLEIASAQNRGNNAFLVAGTSHGTNIGENLKFMGYQRVYDGKEDPEHPPSEATKKIDDYIEWDTNIMNSKYDLPYSGPIKSQPKYALTDDMKKRAEAGISKCWEFASKTQAGHD